MRELPSTAALCLRRVAAKSWRGARRKRVRRKRIARASGVGAGDTGRQVATRALMQMGAVFEVLNKVQQAQCFAAEQRSFVQSWLLSVKVSQSNVVASPMDYRTYP